MPINWSRRCHAAPFQVLPFTTVIMSPKFDPSQVVDVYVRVTDGTVEAASSKIGPLGLSPKVGGHRQGDGEGVEGPSRHHQVHHLELPGQGVDGPLYHLLFLCSPSLARSLGSPRPPPCCCSASSATPLTVPVDLSLVYIFLWIPSLCGRSLSPW